MYWQGVRTINLSSFLEWQIIYGLVNMCDGVCDGMCDGVCDGVCDVVSDGVCVSM